MNWLPRIALVALLGTVLGCAAPAPPPAGPAQGPSLVAFASDEGVARFAHAAARVDFAPLANQYEAQLNAAFCGPTSAAIVLNTMRSRSVDLPRDHGRLRADDLRHLPAGADPIVPRYTPDTVIDAGAKTRAQVLGEPVIVNGRTVRDFGYQVRQFEQLLQAHRVVTKLVIVDDTLTDDRVRAELVRNLEKPGDYVIVNYLREAVGQRGGGHISPLGAYDAASDSFLVLDVNPAAAGWVWMPAATLIKGMRSFDTLENRGYVLVSPR